MWVGEIDEVCTIDGFFCQGHDLTSGAANIAVVAPRDVLAFCLLSPLMAHGRTVHHVEENRLAAGDDIGGIYVECHFGSDIPLIPRTFKILLARTVVFVWVLEQDSV